MVFHKSYNKNFFCEMKLLSASFPIVPGSVARCCRNTLHNSHSFVIYWIFSFVTNCLKMCCFETTFLRVLIAVVWRRNLKRKFWLLLVRLHKHFSVLEGKLAHGKTIWPNDLLVAKHFIPKSYAFCNLRIQLVSLW